MGFRVSWSMVTSLSVALVTNCAGKSSEERDEDSSSSGGRTGSGGRDTGGRNAEAGRAATGGSATGGSATGGSATGGSATGGDRAEGGQAEGGELSTGGTVSTGAPYPRTLEGLFQAQCDAAISCCDKKGLRASPGRCAGEFGWAVIERNLESGVIVLDPDALEDCITAYESAATTCTETGIAQACRGLLAGTKAPGEPCLDFNECDRKGGPVTCRFLGKETVGECVPLVHGEEGTACESDCQSAVECSGNEVRLSDVSRVYCFEDEGLYCSGTCRKLSSLGQECENARACGSDGRCKATSASEPTRSCQTGLELGEPCQTIDRAACAANLWCDGPSGVNDVGVCREVEFYKEAVCEG